MILQLLNFVIAVLLFCSIAALSAIGVYFMLKPRYLFYDKKKNKLFETGMPFHTIQQNKYELVGII